MDAQLSSLPNADWFLGINIKYSLHRFCTHLSIHSKQFVKSKFI